MTAPHPSRPSSSSNDNSTVSCLFSIKEVSCASATCTPRCVSRYRTRATVSRAASRSVCKQKWVPPGSGKRAKSLTPSRRALDRVPNVTVSTIFHFSSCLSCTSSFPHALTSPLLVEGKKRDHTVSDSNLTPAGSSLQTPAGRMRTGSQACGPAPG